MRAHSCKRRRPHHPDGRIACVRPVAPIENLLRNNSHTSNVAEDDENTIWTNSHPNGFQVTMRLQNDENTLWTDSQLDYNF